MTISGRWVSVFLLVGFRVGAAGAMDIGAVTIGNPGNPGELSGASAGGYGPDRICGAVDYVYRIGRYEVTAAQYTGFLNAVAKTDTYGLYNESMWSNTDGCKIQRNGSPGSFMYSVAPDRANRPVNYVSWGDAARFCNWLTNGQPSGVQSAATTENGVYALHGVTSDSALLAVVRTGNAGWVIPSEDEWYKAAYHRNNGTTGDFWTYPTSADSVPGNQLMNPDPGNGATYYNDTDTIGDPYWRTEVGEFENSASPYGTFDQGGNVWEWNEAVVQSLWRGLRGGGYHSYDSRMRASFRSGDDGYPTAECNNVGFRVSNILPGDFDNDGDVDSADFALFEVCFSGPSIPRSPGYHRMDLDGEGDVDQADFGLFQRQYWPPGVLEVFGPDGFVSTGDQGGPFTPVSNAYTVTNTGGQLITWAVGSTQTWLTVSKVGGTLVAGASDTIEISINEGANSLAAGSYSDTLTIANTANHHGDTTRVVALTVNPRVPSSMVLITAGEFQMGNSLSPGDGAADELPCHTVYLDGFYMDKYEVTNQQYADSLNWALRQGNLIEVFCGLVSMRNGGYSRAYCETTESSPYSLITWDGTTFGVVSGKENHPVVMVTWYGSAAYANWRSAMEGRPLCYDLSTWSCGFDDGYRLPTEAEREKAARGGAAGHRFPWSDADTILHSRANYYSSSYYSYDKSPTRDFHPMFSTGSMPYTSPVGYFAANDYGLYGMAGNVWEWCNDWYGAYSAASQVNPHGPVSGTSRVLRGGGWYDYANNCRVACRLGGYNQNERSFDWGFRLVLNAE